MIKVMWICNTYTSDVAKNRNIAVPKVGGWLTGLSDSLKNNDQVSLVYCYPMVGEHQQFCCNIDGIQYYSFYSSRLFGFLNIDSDKDSRRKRQHISNIIEKEKPDIIHVFGTEFVHSLIAIQEARKHHIETVCSIQGLISEVQKRYLDYVPYEYWHKFNISCIFRGTLYGQARKMSRRSAHEIETLKLCSTIIGRTEWDKIHSYFINKKRRYFFCGETLREEFYLSQWHYEKCKKHSIFISQGSSPLKGLNNAILAVSMLKSEFDDIELHIAGNDFVNGSGIVNKLKRSTYADYILSLIRSNHLEQCVHFTGALSACEMIEQYLRSNVFISASTVENSSNSIGEAMILGVPVIASNVGGTDSMIQDGIEGLLYDGKDAYRLAYLIRRAFLEVDNTIRMAEEGREHAMKAYCKENNQNQLVDIYRKLMEKKINE